VIERFGLENTIPVFADTNNEHPDVYRFIDDLERFVRKPFVRLNDGRNVWDVFFKTCFFSLPNGRCKASWELKRIPLQNHLYSLGGPDDVTVYVGFTADEERRQDKLNAAMAPYGVEYPLTWSPPLERCDIMRSLLDRGLNPPSMYADGYPHANCGGACILAGIKQWAGLLQDNPALYAYNENKEQELLAMLRERGRTEITLLKDRRGGIVQNLSLRQLREELEAGVRKPTDTWRVSTCNCMGG
jgi:hypothetical protein